MAKTAIVDSKDWNIVECMSAARFVEYTKEDFKDVDIFTGGYGPVTKKRDISYLCKEISRCPVAKCNLKKAVLEHKKIIMNNIQTREKETMGKTLDDIKEQFTNIERTTGKG